MTDKEEIIQGGVPPEAAEALITADPVDQNKPPDNQVALQTDSGAGESQGSDPTPTQKFTIPVSLWMMSKRRTMYPSKTRKPSSQISSKPNSPEAALPSSKTATAQATLLNSGKATRPCAADWSATNMIFLSLKTSPVFLDGTPVVLWNWKI